MKLRITQAIHAGDWRAVDIPAEATLSVAMLEYFIREFGFEGDYVGVNVRNVGYLINGLKCDMIAQVRHPDCRPIHV